EVRVGRERALLERRAGFSYLGGLWKRADRRRGQQRQVQSGALLADALGKGRRAARIPFGQCIEPTPHRVGAYPLRALSRGACLTRGRQRRRDRLGFSLDASLERGDFIELLHGERQPAADFGG